MVRASFYIIRLKLFVKYYCIIWASLVAQMVKNLPAIRETWVQFLGWDDPLEKGTATHPSILGNSMDSIVQGVTKNWTRLSDFHFHCIY